MLHRNDQLRRGFSLGLSLLMLTLSGVVPMLERADFVVEPVVESEHNPAECPRGHDHTICTQVRTNLSALARTQQAPDAPVVLGTTLQVTASVLGSVTFVDGHRSRAPPTV